MAYAPGTQFNIMGKQPSTGIMNPQAVQADIMTRKMRAARRKAIEMTRKYNKNPHKMSSQEVTETLALAQTYGYNVSQGKKKDLKASFGDILQGVGVGAIDGALLGMIPNSWYENRRNKGYAKGGRIGGTVASMFVPASFLANGGKAAAYAARAAKFGKTAAAAGKAGRAYKLLKVPGAMEYMSVGSKASRAALWAAKNLTTAGQAARLKRGLGALSFNAGVRGGRLGKWGQIAAQNSTKGGMLEKIMKDRTLYESYLKMSGGKAGQTVSSKLTKALSNPLAQGGLAVGGAVMTPIMLSKMLESYGREGNNYDPYQEFLDQTQMSSLPQMPQMPTQ